MEVVGHGDRPMRTGACVNLDAFLNFNGGGQVTGPMFGVDRGQTYAAELQWSGRSRDRRLFGLD